MVTQPKSDAQLRVLFATVRSAMVFFRKMESFCCACFLGAAFLAVVFLGAVFLAGVSF